MRKLKNMVKVIITLTIIISTLVAGIIFFQGYNEYKKAISNIALDKIVYEIKNDKNYTKIEDISNDFLTGIVAIEDRRFFEHDGIDLISLCRAVVSNLKAGRVIEGGSTITQQLAKNLYFDSDQEMSRKVAEFILARDLEKKYSKEEILELYVNIIYYGNDSYGIKQATTGYFGKNPKDITYDEATLLAGIPQAPSYYDLTKNLKGAREKQKYVEKAINENFK